MQTATTHNLSSLQKMAEAMARKDNAVLRGSPRIEIEETFDRMGISKGGKAVYLVAIVAREDTDAYAIRKRIDV